MIILLFFEERSLWISFLCQMVTTIRKKLSSTSPETSVAHSQAWKMQKRSWFLFHGRWSILALCWEVKHFTHIYLFASSYLTWLLDSFNLTYHIYRFLNDLVNEILGSQTRASGQEFKRIMWKWAMCKVIFKIFAPLCTSIISKSGGWWEDPSWVCTCSSCGTFQGGRAPGPLVTFTLFTLVTLVTSC